MPQKGEHSQLWIVVVGFSWGRTTMSSLHSECVNGHSSDTWKRATHLLDSAFIFAGASGFLQLVVTISETGGGQRYFNHRLDKWVDPEDMPRHACNTKLYATGSESNLW